MINNEYLTQIPPKEGRYVVLDTETTGFGKDAHITEFCVHEILNGKITGKNYYNYLTSRPIKNNSFSKFRNYKNTNENNKNKSDREKLIEFLEFIGNSIIFAHNALFDFRFINKELLFWKLPIIPKIRFRCSMKIFKDIIGKENNLYNKFCKLKECCNYFNITSNKYEYHTARFDAFMTSKYICKLYQKLENEKLIFNNINLIEDIETNKNIIKLNEDNKVTNEIIIKNNEIIKVSKINRKKNKITDPKEIVKNIFKEYEIYENKI